MNQRTDFPDCEATLLIDGSTCICEQTRAGLVAFIPILEAVEVVKNTYFEAMNI